MKKYMLLVLPLLTTLTECKGEQKGTNETDSDTSLTPEGEFDTEARTQTIDDGWKFYLGDLSGSEVAAFDDGDWEAVSLPHDWSIHLAFNQNSPAGSGGGFLDGGVGWYRKAFTLPEAFSGKQIFLRFDGAYMNSDVWINGTHLGHRPYGYIWFEYELTPYLNPGEAENVIAVRLDNNQPTSRWYSGSGIYRNVWLTATHPMHAVYGGYFVNPTDITTGGTTVEISLEVANQTAASQPVTIATTISDPTGVVVAEGTSAAQPIAAGGESTLAHDVVVASPALWSVAAPNLYRAVTTVSAGTEVVDTVETTFGVRTFRFDADTGFYLNDVNMKLNGVCLHHDLGALGAAVNYRAIERQLEIMKGMGANAVRTSHNPTDPMLLEICDRLGLLVQEEAFDVWRETKVENDYALYFDEWAERDITAMVRRDRNHPSIIMWSIGNEIADIVPDRDLDGPGNAQRLIALVKAVDPTRVVTLGSNHNGYATEVPGYLDAVGYNYHLEWYDSQHARYPEWKMYASETSSAVRSRGIYHTPTDQNIMPEGAEDFGHQMSSYDNSVVDWGLSAEDSWRAVNTRPFMAGEFVWTGFDYIGEPTPFGWPYEPAWPSKSSYFGIVDTAGFPKDVYYFYKSKWGNEPVVHLLPHWNWSAGQTVEVWAYTNAESVELFLNDASLGAQDFPTDPEEPQHLAWQVPFEAGTIRAEAKSGGVVVAMHAITTAQAPAKIQLLADRTRISADGKDLVFVETNIIDAADLFVPTADNLVTFSVAGPGKIVGVDNGNAASLESYKGTSRSAFSGKCLAIVQAGKEAGEITVTAESPGLAPASVVIQTE